MPRHSYLAAILILILCPLLSLGATVSFLGTFGADNQEDFFSVALNSASTLTLQTFSYGGGVNGAGQFIAAGGFAPELAVFDSTGNLVALDATGGTAPGGCFGRAIDRNTNSCFDAEIAGPGQPPLTLAAGTYTVVLAEQGNNPLGTLADGFSQDAANGGDPSFTGANAGLPGAMFLDPGNSSQRTNQFALDFSGAGIGQVTLMPEPDTLQTLGIGCLLVLCALARRKRIPLGARVFKKNNQ